MRRLEDREVVRVLDLCGRIAKVKPEGVALPLLPEWGRNEMLWAAWRQAFSNPRTQKLLQELGELLRGAQ
jgi:hypothetical protein